MGDSRFMLEPNIKDGKGGLRDLQTLLWISRFLYGGDDPAEMVRQGLLTRQSLGRFLRSRRFLWTVRCHLHYLTGRADDRLTFDVQPEIARRMGYRERNRVRAVERFMKRYYLVAKDVGALTRIFCAALEEQQPRQSRFALPRFGFGRRKINGFVVQGSRLNIGDSGLFEREPIRMLELFHFAQERELDIHPQALAAITHHLSRIDQKVREDPEANRLFLDMLCSRKDPALTLNRMNEAGVLGRFIPDFGRIVAQMQHNLYHVYTVDEHTVRAVGILSQIENGQLSRRAADLDRGDAQAAVPARALCRDLPARHRQGPWRRPQRARRAGGQAAVPALRPARRRHRDRGLAGSPPSRHEPVRLQA